MTDVLALIVLALLVPFVAAALYLAALGLVALLPSIRPVRHISTLRRFAIIVPAHDEETALPALLESLRHIEYPADRFFTLIVADNCTDGTAEVARDAGVAVVERHADQRGKGYALEFGLRHLDRPYDAVLFVDGDCSVSANILREMNRRLDAGASAVQAHYVMRAGSGSSAVLRELALALVHRVRPLAKTRLGLSAGLKGSGMCLTRGLIEHVGWSATGLAEDVEQHNRILRTGVRVHFAADAIVVGQAPESLERARGQHQRWEAGRLSAARGDALALITHGARRRSPAAIDAAVELLLPPISVVAAGLLTGTLAGILLDAQYVWPAGLAGLAAMLVYLGCGVAVLRPRPLDLLRAIAAMPRYVAWKLSVYTQAAFSKPQAWERSQRDEPQPGRIR